MTVYIIAEAGINHNGSFARACQLIEMAKWAGADAVKFQTYQTERICKADNPEFATLKKCELSYDNFRYLFKYASERGIDFISTPDTVEDAEFLDTLGMRYMKIGSANATGDFLCSIKHVRTPLIVSLGMGAPILDDNPERTLIWRSACRMHCVSSYPCPHEQANISRIAPVGVNGFSDHTTGSLCAIMAVARGAKFIEKHFTLDHTDDGPDHHMSVEPTELAAYVRAIRLAESALGDGVRRVMPCEQKTIQQLKDRK